jgi:hypothetical protein
LTKKASKNRRKRKNKNNKFQTSKKESKVQGDLGGNFYSLFIVVCVIILSHDISWI